MRILIYKRTHPDDPDRHGRFGIQTCMGRVRGYAFDAVIGVGGVSGQPRRHGLSGKVNWIGRSPAKKTNPVDPRGPLVTFSREDFRLFEQRGPYLDALAPKLARKIYGSRSRYLLDSLNADEQAEAEQLVRRFLDDREFDHLQLQRTGPRATRVCTPKGTCRPRRPSLKPRRGICG